VDGTSQKEGGVNLKTAGRASAERVRRGELRVRTALRRDFRTVGPRRSNAVYLYFLHSFGESENGKTAGLIPGFLCVSPSLRLLELAGVGPNSLPHVNAGPLERILNGLSQDLASHWGRVPFP